MTFLAGLHGLRGLMAVWVAGYHFSPGGLGPFRVSSYGYLAVDVFFILSGYVMMRSHEADFSQSVRQHYARFLAQRWWRIYPLYASTIVLSLMLIAALKGDMPGLWPVLGSVLLLEGWLTGGLGVNDVVWSLGVEWIGYLFFPLIAHSLHTVRAGTQAVLAALVVAGFVAYYSLVAPASGLTAGLGALIHMGCGFLAGCLLLSVGTACADGLRRWGDLVVAGAVAGLVIVLLLGIRTVALPFLTLIVLGVAGQAPLCNRLLGHPLALFLGRISFSLYLVHKLVEVAYTAAYGHAATVPGRILSTAIVAGLAIGAATILCVTIEEPARRWRIRRLRATARP